ncbi:MAG: putative glycoside hydrolase [Sedimentisphaerales bacterium]
MLKMLKKFSKNQIELSYVLAIGIISISMLVHSSFKSGSLETPKVSKAFQPGVSAETGKVVSSGFDRIADSYNNSSNSDLEGTIRNFNPAEYAAMKYESKDSLGTGGSDTVGEYLGRTYSSTNSGQPAGSGAGGESVFSSTGLGITGSDAADESPEQAEDTAAPGTDPASDPVPDTSGTDTASDPVPDTSGTDTAANPVPDTSGTDTAANPIPDTSGGGGGYGGSAGGGGSGSSSRPIDSNIMGISVIFPPKKLLMASDSWQSAPLKPEIVAKEFDLYDAIWCAQLIAEHNVESWNYLRKNNNVLSLYYTVGNTIRVINDFTFLDYNYINKNHPEWFLLKDYTYPHLTSEVNRKRYREEPSDVYYNRFYLDVGNEAFQNWAAEQYLQMVKGAKYRTLYEFDGVAMDAAFVGHRLFYGFNQAYPKWKYKNNVNLWNDAYFKYFLIVKKKLNVNGKILVVNHTLDYGTKVDDLYWLKMYDAVDGCMSEQPLRYKYGTPLYTGDKWEQAIIYHEKLIDRKLIDWWTCYPEGNGDKYYNEFLYMYCSWLLTKEPGLSYYYADPEKVDGKPVVERFKEYDLPVGSPIIKRYLKGSCWLRDYENAKIVVNPTLSSQMVEIDTSKLWLDWSTKKTMNKIDIPAVSARILLPTPYTEQ